MSTSRISQLRHRIVIEAVSRTPDGGGGASEAWAPVATVWAAVRSATGTESVQADAVSSRVSHTVLMRHRDGVVPAMRLRHGTRILDILAVHDTDDRKRFLTCLCRERDL
ncbi:MAG: phage head closure protein [Hyphomicrobiaceae bacterium]